MVKVKRKLMKGVSGARVQSGWFSGAVVLIGLGRFGREVAVDTSRFVFELMGSYDKEWRNLQRAFSQLIRELQASHGAFQRTLRLGHIWQTFGRMIVSYRLYSITSLLYPEQENRKRLEKLHAVHARRYAQDAVKLKGALLKIGQFASTRMDLLPKPYVKAFSKLQDSVPPVKFPLIEQHITQELGTDLNEVFSFFDPAPVAAASIGQVHFAALKNGQPVAVKVQYPGIEKVVKDDLWVLMEILGTVEKMYPVQLAYIARELCEYVEQELDYLNEAKNLKFFGRIFEENPDVIVPEVVGGLTTKRVLVMKRVDGIKITDWLERQPDPSARKRLLRTLLGAYCCQILRHGAFQADPHPGNFLVTEDGKLAMVDFGCCKIFDEKIRKGFFDLAGAILTQNPDAMEQSLKTLGFKLKQSKKLKETLQKLGILFMEVFMDKSVDSRAEMQKEFSSVLGDLKENPFTRIPQDFVLLGRVFASLGGMLEKYTPGERYEDVILPYLAENALV